MYIRNYHSDSIYSLYLCIRTCRQVKPLYLSFGLRDKAHALRLLVWLVSFHLRDLILVVKHDIRIYKRRQEQICSVFLATHNEDLLVYEINFNNTSITLVYHFRKSVNITSSEYRKHALTIHLLFCSITVSDPFIIKKFQGHVCKSGH